MRREEYTLEALLQEEEEMTEEELFLSDEEIFETRESLREQGHAFQVFDSAEQLDKFFQMDPDDDVIGSRLEPKIAERW